MQPVAVGKVAVGIVSVSDELLVVGIDPATTRILWQQDLTPSGVAAGTRIGFHKVDDQRVAYLRPTRFQTGLARLVVADAATGSDLATSPEALFTSPPLKCLNGKDICVTCWMSYESGGHPYRLELATGRYLEEASDLSSGPRIVGDGGLLDLGDRPGNTLGLVRDGKLAWRTSVSSAFPPKFSSDNGWAWHLFAEQHVFVGSVYEEFTSTSRDLSAGSATAGLSEATGEVLWRDRGSDLSCPVGHANHPVRCRSKGVVTYDDDGAKFRGLDVTVEGFDVRTGKTTWSAAVGAAVSLLPLAGHFMVAGSTEVVLESSRGAIVFDYSTGKTEALNPGATFWCMSGTSYEHWLGFRKRDGSIGHRRVGGDLAAICNDRGESATALPSAAATRAVGANVGGYSVIGTRNGFLTVKLSE